MSRRAAERAIQDGAFSVNGRTAEIGMRVDPSADTVLYQGRPLKPGPSRRLYIMLNKPRGYVTTLSDERGRPTAASLVDAGRRVYPVGRLDLDSEGLLLFTDDGAFANRIMHPSGNIRKVYRAVVRGRVADTQLDAMRAMRALEDEPIVPVGVRLLARAERESTLELVLHEGKNRQIRRMCAAVGLSVLKLRRVALGPLMLGDLEEGAWRHLTAAEKRALDKLSAPKRT